MVHPSDVDSPAGVFETCPKQVNTSLSENSGSFKKRTEMKVTDEQWPSVTPVAIDACFLYIHWGKEHK